MTFAALMFLAACHELPEEIRGVYSTKDGALSLHLGKEAGALLRGAQPTYFPKVNAFDFEEIHREMVYGMTGIYLSPALLDSESKTLLSPLTPRTQKNEGHRESSEYVDFFAIEAINAPVAGPYSATPAYILHFRAKLFGGKKLESIDIQLAQYSSKGAMIAGPYFQAPQDEPKVWAVFWPEDEAQKMRLHRIRDE